MESLLNFEWDVDKAVLNLKKHGISFDEAKTVFFDERAVIFDDPDHSIDEDRFLILGFSQHPRLLIVSHCIRGDGNVIRIISARKAGKKEAKYYEENNL